jgi:hypothetical protein
MRFLEMGLDAPLTARALRGVAGRGEDFPGEAWGGLAFGDSKTTLTGVALTLNERRGDSATLTGEGIAGDLFTGDMADCKILAGVKVMSETFCGDISAGNSETRLLRRLVDRFSSFSASILCVVSSGSTAVGMSNSMRGWSAPTMRAVVVFGSIGQRVLCRFLGTHRKASSGNVACPEGPFAISVGFVASWTVDTAANPGLSVVSSCRSVQLPYL